MDYHRVIFGVVLIAVSIMAVPRPFYIDCTTSDECSKSECCVIGMGRYTLPTCRSLLELGDTCRVMNTPVDTNVSYPDGTEVALTSVYYTVCPCGFGLNCHQEHGTCEDPTNTEYFNDIEYF